MYTFKVLQADSESEEDFSLFPLMHHLRWEVFHKSLNWKHGLQIKACMEFDEYDTEGTFYIVRVNEHNKVDATCRLRSTKKNYMLDDHYREFIENEPVPHTDKVWEISRTCAHPEAARSTEGKTTAQLITAAVEFGLARGVENYISLTTDNLYPMLERQIGWNPKKLGQKQKTPNDYSFALKYNVSYEVLQHLRAKNKIEKPLLYDFDETLNNPKELWHDNLIIPKSTTAGLINTKPENLSGRGSVGTIIP